MTTIRKHSRSSGFTITDNEMYNQRGMSLTAIGALGVLLSKPDGWKVKIEWLADYFAEGDKAVRTALQELAARGFLMRTRERDALGRLRTVTNIADYPAFADMGTVEERINGYQPKATDLALSDRSVNGHVGKGQVLVSTDQKILKDIAPAQAAPGAVPSAPLTPLAVQATLVATDQTPTPSVQAKSKATKASAADKTPTPHQAIVDAYHSTLINYEPKPRINGEEMGKAAKWLLENGYTPDQVEYAVDSMKADEYWQAKHLSLTSVSKQIAALIAKRDGMVKAKAAQKPSPRSRMQTYE